MSRIGEAYSLEEFVERFWARVEKTPNCWIWQGAKDSCGYGHVRRNKKLISAHRMAWQLTNGEIPFGKHVLHRCDNPACLNPEHLWLGTHQENMKDRDQKGRANGGSGPGEECAHAKLTEEDARTILDLCKRGYLQKDCAVLWNVHKSTVNDLVCGKTWRHLQCL